MNQTHSASRVTVGTADGSRTLPGLNAPEISGAFSQSPDASMGCLREAVASFLHTVEPTLDGLEERLEQLKEEAADRLRPLALRLGGGSSDRRLVMELDAEGFLHLVGAENDAAKAADKGDKGDNGDDEAEYETVLAADAATEALMRSLAVESALARCVDDLRHINALLRENRSARKKGAPSYPAYQVCLKGPLSHFYFPRS